jgi:hypothetical protein
MINRSTPPRTVPPSRSAGHTIRLPGFSAGVVPPGETEIGFGDVIKKATSRAGIMPCAACAARAARLNAWVSFSSRR